jgi:hypothetical protein
MSQFFKVGSFPRPSPELSFWMPDAACTNCRRCRRPFTFFLRRHHCRLCLHVFCGACCGTFVSIPDLLRQLDSGVEAASSPPAGEKPASLLSSWFSTQGRPAERVCTKCRSAIVKVNLSRDLIEVLVCNRFLDLNDWPALCCVSRRFRAAVDFLKRKWGRMAQNVLYTPNQTDPVACKLLSQNAQLLAKHPDWCIRAACAGLDVVRAGDFAPAPRTPPRNAGRARSDAIAIPRAREDHDADADDSMDFSSHGNSDSDSDSDGAASHAPVRGFLHEFVAGGLPQSFGDSFAFSPPAAPPTPPPAPFRSGCGAINCHRPCPRQLDVYHCFKILLNLRAAHPLHRQALVQLKSLPTVELLPFVPSLEWLSITTPSVLDELLVPAAQRDAELATMAYFYARSNPNLRGVKAVFFQKMPRDLQRELSASEFFLSALLGMMHPSLVPSARHAHFDTHVLDSRPFLPGTTRFRVVGLDCGSLQQLASYTRPWVVRCTLWDEINRRSEDRVIMIKNESVYNDLTVQLVQQYLLQKDPSLCLLPYHVVALEPKRGLVLFVKDCVSLAEIDTRGGSILQHLMERNQTATVKDVQLQFMRSAAASSILSLLLGFADRHLGNILVHQNFLLHVDFDYLWGQEPALSSHQFTLPAQHIRLTKQMLDVFRNHHYADFLQLCTKINRKVRSVAPNVYFICWSLTSVSACASETLMSHFNAYMLPYTIQTYTEADMAIINVLEKDTRTTTSASLQGMISKLLKYLDR